MKALLYLMVPDKEVLFLFVKGGVCSQLCPQNLSIVIVIAMKTKKMIKAVVVMMFLTVA